MVTTIVVGGFFGDEGKGKIVAHIAFTDHPSIIARGGVGPNAGHTVFKDGVKHGVRMIPSGFVYDKARLLIGAGVLVDPNVLDREVALLHAGDRLGVDRRCSIIEQKHIDEDKGTQYLAKKIGTTGTGCGPANKERVMRTALQAKDVPALKKYLTDVSQECNDAISRGESVIIEGSQGFGISLFYGTYPFVTSKDTSASALASDVGVGPTRIDEVVVVFKAFPDTGGRRSLRHGDARQRGGKAGHRRVRHRHRAGPAHRPLGREDGPLLGHDQRRDPGGRHRPGPHRPGVQRSHRLG